MNKLTQTLTAMALFSALGVSTAQTSEPQKPAAKAPAKAASAKTTSAKGAATAAPAATLSPEQLEIAKRVYTGRQPCELGASVTVTADAKTPGMFNVSTGKSNFRMTPVATTTGAIRLEDSKAGAVWLQLGNKSMLMNQKIGQRLADDCQSSEQKAVIESLKTNPAPNLLEPATPAAPGTPVPSGPISATKTI